MRNLISIIALVLGIAAVGIAIFEHQIAASKPDKRTAGELIGEAGKRFLKEKVLKEKAPPAEQLEAMNPIRITYTSLGFAAIVLGIVSWIRNEHRRMAGVAISLGVIAACWQWFLIGVAIAAVLLILANLG